MLHLLRCLDTKLCHKLNQINPNKLIQTVILTQLTTVIKKIYSFKHEYLNIL